MKASIALLGLALVMTLTASPLLAQQGEGTGADFELLTRRNAGSLDDMDKALCAGDAVQFRFQSPGMTYAGAGILLLGDIAPVSFNIFEPAGGLNLGTGTNRFLVIDGIIDPSGPALDGMGVADVNFIVPASQDWIDGGAFAQPPVTDGVDDWGFFGQAMVADPAGIFGLVQVSNTVKHAIGNELNELFSDTCADALLCDGLSDADLGVAFNIADTSLYNNDIELANVGGTPAGTFTQETIFDIVAPGNGAPQGRAADAFIVFEATGGGSYSFDLCASTFDSNIALIELDCVTGIVTNDDHQGTCPVGTNGLRSRITNFCLSAGQTVIIWIDGFGTTSTGLASLVITKQPLVLNSISPDNGDLLGGDTVTLNGCGLGAVTGVSFDGNPAVITAQTSTSIDVVTPPGAAAGMVMVEATDGVNTSNQLSFTYVDNALPSFSNCSSPGLAIDAVTPTIQDTLVITTIPGAQITSVDVDMDITHTFLGDLSIDLTSPGMTLVRLKQDDPNDVLGTGGDDDVIGNYPMTLPVDGPGTLADFDGEDPNGTWTLDVSDSFAGSGDGVLNMWCVNGTYSLPIIATGGSSTPGLVISNGAPPTAIQDTIVVPDVTPVTMINVDINITHTWVGDLEVDLTSPALTVVSLRNNTGGSADDLIGNYPMTLTEFGPSPTSTGVTGTLVDFTGELANGNWVLDVRDTANGDGGTLNSWGININ